MRRFISSFILMAAVVVLAAPAFASTKMLLASEKMIFICSLVGLIVMSAAFVNIKRLNLDVLAPLKGLGLMGKFYLPIRSSAHKNYQINY